MAGAESAKPRTAPGLPPAPPGTFPLGGSYLASPPGRCREPSGTGPARLAAPTGREGRVRGSGQLVQPVSDTTIIAEAEEFKVDKPDGWKAKGWGENYFTATFANSFLSRKAFLGAPEQCDESIATIEVQVPKAGRYLVLARYESVYRFKTSFRIRVEQDGKPLFDRLYGARDNLKVWAFGQKLKREIAWGWGAVENVVWEGHDAAVRLEAGRAKLSLVAGRQTGNTAKRNVDLILLTSDEKQVKDRIDKEGYLPLDGMLTQAGDVYLKVHNAQDSAPLTLTVPPGTEHSPYWVHIRTWKSKTITATPGQSTDWVEVGSLLDSLNDGQWLLTAKPSKPGGALRFSLAFGVRDAAGKIESVRQFKDLSGDVALAYDADTRYSRRIRLQEEVLYDLLAYLKKQPVRGSAPKRTLIYGSTFDRRPADPKYNAAIDEFIALSGATVLYQTSREQIDRGGLVRGYVDWRGQTPAQLEKFCQRLKAEGLADRVAVVSLGDEIPLDVPPATPKVQADFRAWLQKQGLKPADIDQSAANWEQVKLSPDKDTAVAKPKLYYYSQIYRYRYGIGQLKALTDVLRKHLPNAGIGANFSPHHKTLYLGDTSHWISTFREDGMTMPWGEDYIWQVPVGTQQMNFLMLDMFRCGIKGKPGAKIHYYVMPHTPGNTPNSWRRQFYGDLAHGAKVLNLFEYRPVQAAYTENHCSDPRMYQTIRQALHELGQFEDIVQDGQVRPGVTALWFSEAADAWDDYQHSLGAGKRSLYIAIRHQQLPLDCVLDGDDLKSYKVLYLTDRHVSRAGSKAIAEWVKAGGHLFATAGAGMFDEFNQPNKVLRELLGADETALIHADEDVKFEKQDLPFAKPLGTGWWLGIGGTMPRTQVFGTRSRFKAAKDVEVIVDFGGGSPAVGMRKVGKGRAFYCGFLPGLSYFKPAVPLRPVDRGASDETMAHFIPTKFDEVASALVKLPASGAYGAKEIEWPVVCSEPLVENTVIEAKSGVVIPLVNWSAGPVKGLTVTVSLNVPSAKVSLASGRIVRHKNEGGKQVFTLDLDVADALILR
ncbi:MAG: beta-galactosidase trimerization domain-containing protein [Planctomycetes bacterium]|nr:beta-galactosidase trimerization domain-containing protein [Planctomycetota bacterium]